MDILRPTKTYYLSFLGDGWKDAYLEFQTLSMRDIKERFPKFSSVDTTDPKAVVGGIDEVLKLLGEKFVSGKVPNSKKELVELKFEDLQELPADVLTGAVSFLSQTQTSNLSPKQ